MPFKPFRRPGDRIGYKFSGVHLLAARVTEPTLDHTATVLTPGLGHDDVSAAAAGDRRAFERVYRAHVDRVFALCVRMLGDRVLAEEVVQDVFVRVWQKLPGFRGESAFSTWLHRVAVNVILSHRKQSGLHHARHADSEVLEDSALTAGRHEAVGDRMDLEGAIATLPRGARMVFVLHDVQGFTHEEIGEQLGISPGGSKAQLHRARMLLRNALTR